MRIPDPEYELGPGLDRFSDKFFGPPLREVKDMGKHVLRRLRNLDVDRVDRFLIGVFYQILLQRAHAAGPEGQGEQA